MASYVERVRAGFDGQRFMGFIGAQLENVTEGSCEILLPYRDGRIKVCQANVFCRSAEKETMCAAALVSVIATRHLSGGQ